MGMINDTKFQIGDKVTVVTELVTDDDMVGVVTEVTDLYCRVLWPGKEPLDLYPQFHSWLIHDHLKLHKEQK